MTKLLILSLIAAFHVGGASITREEQFHAGEIVALLQDIAEDYCEALESNNPERRRRTESLVETAVHHSEVLPVARRFVPALEHLARVVRASQQPVHVETASRAISQALAAAANLPQAPRKRPVLARGQALYAVGCAACHGSNGRPVAPFALAQDPPPANLVDSGTVNSLSPYRVYNAITYGIYETAMPSFGVLSNDDRWALAFFVLTLRQPQCKGGTHRVALGKLAVSTDSELVAAHGEGALACLRRQP